MDIVTVTDLVKKYKEVEAVRGVSFDVKKGEIFGFLGPNGAGKSTTIKMLATLVQPTSGRAVLNGFDVARDPDRVRRSIGLVFQDPSLDNNLTAEENLFFHAMLYDVGGEVLANRMKEVLAMVELEDRRKSLVSTFSGGMKRRLEIARGLLHHPAILFLDEPTVGLDPQTRSRIWQYVRDLRDREGITIFMTTHYMDEAENCDRIAIIDHGKIVALDTPAQLKRMVGGEVLTARTVDDAALAKEIESTYDTKVTVTKDGLQFEVERGAEFIPEFAGRFQGKVKAISLHQPTLDDVFLKLTGRAIREETAGAVDQMRANARMWQRRR